MHRNGESSSPCGAGKWYRSPFVIVVAVFIILDLLLLGVYISHHVKNKSPTTSNITHGQCAMAQGPFTQKDAQIYQANGKVYTPYGTTIEGLSGADYKQKVPFVESQIKASAGAWCSNTVRFQVAQDNLLGSNGTNYSADYMNTMKSLFSQAEKAHMVVVICAQTEVLGQEPGPTAKTVKFWKDINDIYGNDPQVVYDLFNEPRVGHKKLLPAAQVWQIWQHGGVFQSQTYVGMQELVNDVRSFGSKNLLWIEGPRASSTFGGIKTHQIVNAAPMMYAMHHPTGKHQPATWDRDFGYLPKQNIAPVVVGEWSNWAANRGECWPNAPTAVPAFLSYLQTYHIGLTVWTLQKNVMVESDDLTDPTHIKSDWNCKSILNEGAGSLVMDFFKQNNT